MDTIRFCLFILQVVLSAWCFHTVVPQTQISHTRQALSQLLLLLLFPLFMSATPHRMAPMVIWGNVIRFFWRTLIYVLYLRSWKNKSWDAAIYLSLLITTIFTACQVIVQIIVACWDAYPICNLLYIPVISLTTSLLPMAHSSRITAERKIIIALLVSCILYIKTSFFDFSIAGQFHVHSYELPTYLILLNVFLILFLIFFERHAYKVQEEERYRAQEMENNYLLHSLNAREVSDRELRALHHDMKNHFLAIQKIAKQEHCEAIQQYTQELLGRSTSFESQICTGNHLLDGLLEEKCSIAKDEGIRTEVTLDFHSITFIEPIDLCAIFSNAMDNAIEACRKVPQPDLRYIRISSTVAAQQLFVTIQNSYTGTLTFYKGRPVTTKFPSYHHGYGLANLESAIKKYGGVSSVATDDTHGFVLTLVFPVPA